MKRASNGDAMVGATICLAIAIALIAFMLINLVPIPKNKQPPTTLNIVKVANANSQEKQAIIKLRELGKDYAELVASKKPVHDIQGLVAHGNVHGLNKITGYSFSMELDVFSCKIIASPVEKSVGQKFIFLIKDVSKPGELFRVTYEDGDSYTAESAEQEFSNLTPSQPPTTSPSPAATKN